MLSTATITKTPVEGSSFGRTLEAVVVAHVSRCPKTLLTTFMAFFFPPLICHLSIFPSISCSKVTTDMEKNWIKSVKWTDQQIHFWMLDLAKLCCLFFFFFHFFNCMKLTCPAICHTIEKLAVSEYHNLCRGFVHSPSITLGTEKTDWIMRFRVKKKKRWFPWYPSQDYTYAYYVLRVLQARKLMPENSQRKAYWCKACHKCWQNV